MWNERQERLAINIKAKPVEKAEKEYAVKKTKSARNAYYFLVLEYMRN